MMTIEEIKAQEEAFSDRMYWNCVRQQTLYLWDFTVPTERMERFRQPSIFWGIRYTGTGYLSSALAMDKGLTKKIFLMDQVPTPKGVSMLKENCTRNIHDLGMEFPVVVKTCCGGSSVGVYIVNNQKEYEDAIDGAYSYEDEVVVEEYIRGREFSVAVVDGKAYPIIEIAPKQGFYDYKNKYQAGSTVETCPAEISPELTEKMQHYAEAGAKALCIEGYARFDFMMKENGDMYCLEANTLPGMTPTSLIPQEAKVLGIDYPDLCEELIRYFLLKKYRQNKYLTVTPPVDRRSFWQKKGFYS